MNIQEIVVKDYPIVIFSDSHCSIKNIKKLKELYPNSLIISLGDITNLWAKKGEQFNKYIIDYFIKSKIPNLLGNHCEHIINCAESDSGNRLVIFRALVNNFSGDSLYDSYGLDKNHLEYLKSLPIGFKLILPNGKNYLCYHHAPNNLWGFFDYNKLNEQEFKDNYPIDDNTLAVLHGHTHLNFICNYANLKTKRISIGSLSKDSDYLLITENGTEFKKI